MTRSSNRIKGKATKKTVQAKATTDIKRIVPKADNGVVKKQVEEVVVRKRGRPKADNGVVKKQVEEVVVRKRGRPKADSGVVKKQVEEVVVRKRGKPKADNGVVKKQVEEVVVRKRGRPKADSGVVKKQVEEVVVRKRGRPKADNGVVKKRVEEVVVRKRGRPKADNGVVKKQVEEVVVRKRGRPKADSGVVKKQVEEVVVRKRGRPKADNGVVKKQVEEVVVCKRGRPKADSGVVKKQVEEVVVRKRGRPKADGTKKPIIRRLTKKALSDHDEETIGLRPSDRGSSWDGNSESDGSVNSGVLDENQCFECGLYSGNEDWGKVALCDVCDGEYHFECTGLVQLPRLSWTCNACVQERNWFMKMKHYVHASFPLPRRPPRIDMCYSPSRPLDLAWEECKQKGFMIVKRVFDIEVMRKLTHGVINKVTKSGRVADTWNGAVNAIAEGLTNHCHNIINRDGRYDLKLPDYVVRELHLDEVLAPICEKLRTIMHNPTPILRTHNVVFAPVGSKEQNWHVDDSMRQGKLHSYFTILIHLNPIDDKCGGTEIWSKSLKRGDMIRARPGDAFVFNGSLLHRGQANYGYSHRFFYYASFSCRADTNDGL